MTLTLTGRNIDYRQYKNNNGELVIEVYDYLNKAAFKAIEASIHDALNEPLKVTLYRYEVIPWNTKEIPEQKNPYIPKYSYINPKTSLFAGHKIKNGCHNCTHHNYDWYSDDGYGGDEFEICEKGNDLEGPCKDWEEL